jgi:transposase-like protein
MGTQKINAKTKAQIVLEGLRGKPVAEICNQYQISQTHYYRLRDLFLSNMHQAFENTSQQEAKLTRENDRLKQIIGDLTVELKKSDLEWR